MASIMDALPRLSDHPLSATFYQRREKTGEITDPISGCWRQDNHQRRQPMPGADNGNTDLDRYQSGNQVPCYQAP
jgi:hypothetical protein